MYELTKQELKNLRSQFATSSWGGSRYPPFAFTELWSKFLKLSVFWSSWKWNHIADITHACYKQN